MTVNTLIILAAGMSSRMKASADTAGLDAADIKQADTLTKGLIPVGETGRPLLDFIFDNAIAAGLTNIILITGFDNAVFKSRYGNKKRSNNYGKIVVSYAVQRIPSGRSKPLGTADAVLQALQQYPELQTSEFLVCNCDNLYSAKAFRALAETPHPHAFIAYNRMGLQFSSEKIARFALCILDERDFLTQIVEKPDPALLPDYQDRHGVIRVSMNIFKFSGNPFLHHLEKCPVSTGRNEKELAAAITGLIEAHPCTMIGIPFNEHVPDLTEKSDIVVFRNYLRKASSDTSD
ncbi:MAG: sugar phosphate nucleotidyltransferase [Calditrichia bacterium]